MAGGEALREHVQGEGLQPLRLLATGAGGVAFGPGAEYARGAMNVLAPELAPLAPGPARMLGEGTIANTFVRGDLGSLAATVAGGEVQGAPPEAIRRALPQAFLMGGLTSARRKPSDPRHCHLLGRRDSAISGRPSAARPCTRRPNRSVRWPIRVLSTRRGGSLEEPPTARTKTWGRDRLVPPERRFRCRARASGAEVGALD